MTTDLEFARKLVADKLPVLHIRHLVLGIPTKAFAPGEYGVTDQERGLDCVVLQFDDGNSFVVNGDHNEFVQLTEFEHAVYEGIIQSLRDVLVEAVTTLRSSDPKGERHAQTRAIIHAAIAAQTRSLTT